MIVNVILPFRLNSFNVRKVTRCLLLIVCSFNSFSYHPGYKITVSNQKWIKYIYIYIYIYFFGGGSKISQNVYLIIPFSLKVSIGIDNCFSLPFIKMWFSSQLWVFLSPFD